MYKVKMRKNLQRKCEPIQQPPCRTLLDEILRYSETCATVQVRTSRDLVQRLAHQAQGQGIMIGLVIRNLDRSDDGQDQCGDSDREQHGNANQDKGQRDATKAI